jgi:3-isopropylmalate dehydrogenase
MMLRFSFDLAAEADAIERAVEKVLAEGLRTFDIVGASGATPLLTAQMTQAIIDRL